MMAGGELAGPHVAKLRHLVNTPPVCPGQRVRNRQPEGGDIGDGGSPTGTLSAGRTSGSGTGIASISSPV
jgi:hypothetical protein